MPYFVHEPDQDPAEGTPFGTKAYAVQARKGKQKITCIANNDEQQAWRERETDRFASGVYAPLPWLCAATDVTTVNHASPVPLCCRTLLNGDHAEPTVFENYRTNVLREYTNNARDHFAHISMQSDGMIAYTPDSAHGIEDRQKRVRAGRYLEMVAPFLSQPHRDVLCAQIKAHATAEFKLATTADDIVNVYHYGKGFSSCMDGRHFNHDNSPVRVYGDSDLAVAYLGTIGLPEPDEDDNDDDDYERELVRCGCPDCMHKLKEYVDAKHAKENAIPRNRVTARCVVWPEPKIYTRVYGDPILAFLLRNAGYKNGSLSGARVRRIAAMDRETSADGFLMPYVDGAEYCRLEDEEPNYVRLTDSPTRKLVFSAKEQGGVITLVRHTRCRHCDDRFIPSDDSDTLCDDCAQSRWTCDQCETDYYDSDSRTLHENHRGMSISLCSDCDRDIAFVCGECDDVYYDDQFQNATQRRWSENYDGDATCPICTVRLMREEAAQNPELPLTTTPQRLAFQDIPIGARIRVIEIPHHTATKTGPQSVRWYPCGDLGNSLCMCTSIGNQRCLETVGIPPNKRYEVIEDAPAQEIESGSLHSTVQQFHMHRCYEAEQFIVGDIIQCERIGDISSVWFSIDGDTCHHAYIVKTSEHPDVESTLRQFRVGARYEVIGLIGGRDIILEVRS